MLEGKNKQVQNRSKYLAKPMCESRDFLNLYSLKMHWSMRGNKKNNGLLDSI